MWVIEVQPDGTPIRHIQVPNSFQPLTEPRGDKNWYVVATLIKPDLGENQEYIAPVYDTTAGTITYGVHDKTALELEAEALVRDFALLFSAGKDTALVLTEFFSWALANTTMTANDFSPSVRQAYLDLKAIADRVK